jgi:pyridoxal phosphate enzyme (YggS family)
VAELAFRRCFTHFCRVDLAANFANVREAIAQACTRAGRDPDSVSVVAITKGQPPEMVQAAADLGHTLFGENRVQEARIKIARCPGHLQWHMVGHLQTNKCRDAVGLFGMIESVDSLHLAEELDACAAKRGKTVPVLLEVNIAGESSKFGYAPDRLLEEFKSLNALTRLEIHGLMTVAPYARDPEKVRPVFRQLRDLKLRCEDQLGVPLPHLSMGMSGDYIIAVEEGATLVRLGTVLFGARAVARKALQSQVPESEDP